MHIFYLVLGVTFYLTIKIVHKSPKISKNYSQKLSKFKPNKKIGQLISALILYLLATDDVLQKEGRKQNLI